MIKLLRLKSDEVLVADVEVKDDKVILDTPAMMVPMRGGTADQVQMGLGPWVPFTSDKKIEVSLDWVVFMVEPEEAITDNYRQMFGSGLVVPQVAIDTKKVLTE